MRNIQIECIVFRKNDDKYEFLLLKRIPKKGGFWQPITGGYEVTDKSLIDTVFREINEETNIPKEDILRVIEKVHYFEFTKHYLTNEPIPLIKEYVFGAEVSINAKVSINNNVYIEHDEFKWVSYESALKLLKWQENKDAFENLRKII